MLLEGGHDLLNRSEHWFAGGLRARARLSDGGGAERRGTLAPSAAACGVLLVGVGLDSDVRVLMVMSAVCVDDREEEERPPFCSFFQYRSFLSHQPKSANITPRPRARGKHAQFGPILVQVSNLNLHFLVRP